MLHNFPSSLIEGVSGDILKAERGVASCGGWIKRLVSGGSGLRSLDPAPMPEKDSAGPAENRHGGAPKGERAFAQA
jgi:hypothetical protein